MPETEHATCMRATTPKRWRVCAWRALACLVACLAGGAGVRAQEIAPFRMTNVEGFVQLRSQQESYSATQAGAASTRLSQQDMRSEVFLLTHSYVYHPNFLSLDVGGGPVLQRGVAQTDSGDYRGGGNLYNFTARATLFNQKPVRGTLFYEHLNPFVAIAPGQVMNQQTVKQGFDFSALEPLIPVPVQVNFTRTRSEGRSPDRVVDDRTEQLNVSATRSLGALGVTRLQVQHMQQDSQSGAQNLPIQAVSSQTQSANFDTTLHLGDERQYTLTNLMSRHAQTYGSGISGVPDRNDFRWMTDWRARHSEQWSSYVLSNYNTSQQGSLHTTLQNLASGVTYWHDPQLSTSASMQLEQTTASQFKSDSRVLDAGVRYQRELWGGTASLNYSARYEEHTQNAQTTSTGVFGEKKTLSGFAWYPLSYPHVVDGTVVVSDITRSQTFRAGTDYIVVVSGQETRIQRTASGSILEGQEILVDYQYALGGSFAYNQVTHSVNLAYAPTHHTTLSVRLRRVTPQLQSGTPAYALNHIQSAVVGVRTDYPINASYNTMLGFNLEGEERQETLLSSHSESLDSYVQSDDPWGGGNLRITFRQNKVRYSGSSPNVDLKGWGARYWWRVGGMDVSSDLGWERDTGGLEVRTRTSASLKAQWRIRMVSLNFNLSAYREQSGLFLRNNRSMSLNLRRDL
jgi:hypothetical protein